MHVLLVEDSPEVSLITVEYLTELGHLATPVADAEQALEKLALQPFDAVLTDVSLPGMSGIELAKAITKTHPGLPVVIASGYGAVNVEMLLGQQAAVMVLAKPYDLGTLERTLNQAASLAKS